MSHIKIKSPEELEINLKELPNDIEELSIGGDWPGDAQKIRARVGQVALSNLSMVTKLTSLKKFSLLYFELKPQALLDISQIKSLTELSLDTCNVNKKLDWTTRLTSLDKLSISYGNIKDVTSLKELKSLTVLRLFTNDIANLEPLSGLSDLIELDLGCNKIKDLSPLSGLSKLQQLRCNGYSQLESLKPLEGLKRLKKLTVDILKKEKNRFSKVRPDVEIRGQFFSS